MTSEGYVSLFFQNISLEHGLEKAMHRELSWILISMVLVMFNIFSQLPRTRSEHSTYLCDANLTITSNHSSYTSKRVFKFPTFIYTTYCTERSESKTPETKTLQHYSPCDDFASKEVPRPLFSQVFFQIVGKEPFFSLLAAPSTWTDLSNESGEKWSEQTTKRPSGLKWARCVPTKAFHFARRVLSIGDLWTEIPADISETLLHPCTTQRREGMPLQEIGKRKLGTNSFEYYSFFLAEPEQQLPLGIPN